MRIEWVRNETPPTTDHILAGALGLRQVFEVCQAETAQTPNLPQPDLIRVAHHFHLLEEHEDGVNAHLFCTAHPHGLVCERIQNQQIHSFLLLPPALMCAPAYAVLLISIVQLVCAGPCEKRRTERIYIEGQYSELNFPFS
ncbi:hypothetical protein BU26DRAFT_122962 [Trematosphaeria pertusa]|uniref:Uncharacterized protein n=1 Tax=Trematosphaeria pertusa TaxID=390896 RepID=A0A6A6HYV0_9PLEO|nr:uncharacterized protein BU26DRAFT_122962 [Trematosphaeria pertusa]KAF2242958.1 hypothetical protein BU26DRAFT_122962 [Trematosphaeria pertusa]